MINPSKKLNIASVALFLSALTASSGALALGEKFTGSWHGTGTSVRVATRPGEKPDTLTTNCSSVDAAFRMEPKKANIDALAILCDSSQSELPSFSLQISGSDLKDLDDTLGAINNRSLSFNYPGSDEVFKDHYELTIKSDDEIELVETEVYKSDLVTEQWTIRATLKRQK